MKPYFAPELTDKVNSILWSIGNEQRAILTGAVLLWEQQDTRQLGDAYHAWSGKRDCHVIKKHLTDCLVPLDIAVHDPKHNTYCLTENGDYFAKPIAVAALHFVAETNISLCEIFPGYMRTRRNLPLARNTAELLLQLSLGNQETESLERAMMVQAPVTLLVKKLLQSDLKRLSKAGLVEYSTDGAQLTGRGRTALPFFYKLRNAFLDEALLKELQSKTLELTADITTKAMEIYRKKSPY